MLFKLLAAPVALPMSGLRFILQQLLEMAVREPRDEDRVREELRLLFPPEPGRGPGPAAPGCGVVRSRHHFLADVDLVYLVLASSGTLTARPGPLRRHGTDVVSGPGRRLLHLGEATRDEAVEGAAPPASPAVPAAEPVSAGLHPMEPGTYSDGEQRPAPARRGPRVA